MKKTKGILTEYDHNCMFCGRPTEYEHHFLFGNGLRDALNPSLRGVDE